MHAQFSRADVRHTLERNCRRLPEPEGCDSSWSASSAACGKGICSCRDPCWRQAIARDRWCELSWRMRELPSTRAWLKGLASGKGWRKRVSVWLVQRNCSERRMRLRCSCVESEDIVVGVGWSCQVEVEAGRTRARMGRMYSVDRAWPTPPDCRQTKPGPVSPGARAEWRQRGSETSGLHRPSPSPCLAAWLSRPLRTPAPVYWVGAFRR